MKTEHAELLKTLGLTSIETKTYLTLLEIGKSVAGTVAQKAHLHRRNVYDALEKLLQRGLVSYTITNGKKYWQAVHPEKILSIIREQENSISSALPEWIAQFNSSKSKRTVEVFEGLGGMKTFFDDMIKSNQEIIMLFATGKAYFYLPYYMKKWDRELNHLKIKVKVLLNDGIDHRPYHNYKFGKIKVLPKDLVSPTQIFIYGNKSCVAMWSEDPLAILITSEDITAGFRKYFEFLWRLGKEIR